MGGCGSHCRCTDESSNEKEGVCATREGGVALDENGKCPCGKTKEDCCLPVQSQTQAGYKEELSGAVEREYGVSEGAGFRLRMNP